VCLTAISDALLRKDSLKVARVENLEAGKVKLQNTYCNVGQSLLIMFIQEVVTLFLLFPCLE
jgi:hypothetical protein